jgi:polyisoprenoid-binding protein YceI
MTDDRAANTIGRPLALLSALHLSRKEIGMSAVAKLEQELPRTLWRVDPDHSAVEFRVRHLMVESVKGRFLDFDGAIETGESPTLVGLIRVASLDTHHAERDAHLRSPDFFDAERHPEIVFASTNVELDDDGSLAVAGDLTIKGVTRPVELAGTFLGGAIDLDGRERIGFQLRGELERDDFGLTWNRLLETGGVLVGNTVELALDVAAVRAS